MPSSLHTRNAFARVRVIAAAALAFATLTAASCGDDDENFDVAATYELTGVASASAPQIMLNPQGQTFPCGTGLTCEFQTGSVTLNENGTFQISVQGLQRPTGGATGTGTQISFISPAAATGTWAQSGSAITFTPSASAVGTFPGTLMDGNRELRVTTNVSGSNSYVLRFEQD